MNRHRFAKTALMAIILGASGATACDEPAKSAADTQGDGGPREGVDRAGSGDKSHCAGDEKH